MDWPTTSTLAAALFALSVGIMSMPRPHRNGARFFAAAAAILIAGKMTMWGSATDWPPPLRFVMIGMGGAALAIFMVEMIRYTSPPTAEGKSSDPARIGTVNTPLRGQTKKQLSNSRGEPNLGTSASSVLHEVNRMDSKQTPPTTGIHIESSGAGTGMEVVSEGRPGQSSLGAEFLAHVPAGQNAVGAKVVQSGPGVGLKVTQIGSGVGFRSVAIAGNPDKTDK